MVYRFYNDSWYISWHGACDMTLGEIFITSVKIGFLSYGGGNTTIVLFHREYVEKRKAIDEETFSHMIGPSIFVPGPSGLNIAYATGMEVHGIVGAILSMVGIMLPPLLIVIPLWLILKKTSEIPALSGLKLALKVVGGTMALYAALVILERILSEKGKVKVASLAYGLTILALLALGVNLILVVILSIITAPLLGIFVDT